MKEATCKQQEKAFVVNENVTENGQNNQNQTKNWIVSKKFTISDDAFIDMRRFR